MQYMKKIDKIIQGVYGKYCGEKFKRELLSNQKRLDKITDQHRYIKIQKTVWPYTVFNCSYMTNVANLAVYSLSRGYTPIFDVHPEGGQMIGKPFLNSRLVSMIL